MRRSYSQGLGFKNPIVFALGPALGHISKLDIALYWSEMFGSVGMLGIYEYVVHSVNVRTKFNCQRYFEPTTSRLKASRPS